MIIKRLEFSSRSYYWLVIQITQIIKDSQSHFKGDKISLLISEILRLKINSLKIILLKIYFFNDFIYLIITYKLLRSGIIFK